MAGQRIDIMQLQHLIQLKQKGFSNRKIATALGASRNTINSYVRAFAGHELSWDEVAGLTEIELRELFPQDTYKDQKRYEELATYFPYFSKELTKPGCTLQALWREYLGRHPSGYRYTQFVTYFNRWADQTTASGILQHKAGQKLFVDFAGKKLPYVDRKTGEVRRAEVFVAILPASQYTWVQAVDSQKREDFIGCMNGCLQWLGGVPQTIVSDNLKSAVSKGHKYAPVINKTLKAFAMHYGCIVDPARPYCPQDKAMVEGAVKLVYQRIYYPLSKQLIRGLSQLNKAIREQLTIYNDYSFQHAKQTRRQRFLEIEKALLQPLPPHRYQLRYYKRAKVQKISHIWLSEDKNYYSVPHRYVGRRVEVQYNREVVEIFYNHERIAIHARTSASGRYHTIKEHMPSAHQAYSDWSPQYFQRRARKIGDYSSRYIERLIRQYPYPEWGYRQAQGILALAKYYSPDRLESACRRALAHHESSYRTIENILKNNLDQAKDLFDAPEHAIPLHDNIRGPGHYT